MKKIVSLLISIGKINALLAFPQLTCTSTIDFDLYEFNFQRVFFKDMAHVKINHQMIDEGDLDCSKIYSFEEIFDLNFPGYKTYYHCFPTYEDIPDTFHAYIVQNLDSSIEHNLFKVFLFQYENTKADKWMGQKEGQYLNFKSTLQCQK